MNSFESLGIIPIAKVDEVLTISKPVVEAAVQARDKELARSAFTAVAHILQHTGHITPSLAESFLLESEQRIAEME